MSTLSLMEYRNLSFPAEYSSSRSSRATVGCHGSKFMNKGLEVYTTQSSSSGSATAIEVFVETLHRSKLPGPIILIDEKYLLGRGSQFIVYKQKMALPEFTQFSTRDIAVKIPKFPLDPNVPLKLADPAAQKHLHDIYLEVLALANPTIRTHSYVARLLGWSYDHDTYNTRLYLVMELALCNLRAFLQDHDLSSSSLSLRMNLCRNVAAGLDVLHECDLIHGDIKPDNILIFEGKGGSYVAKVADFGLSVTEAMSGPIQITIGGTFGWQAPEVDRHQAIHRYFFLHTESYSFGLLAWSVMLLNGRIPPSNDQTCRRDLALGQVNISKEKLGESLHGILEFSLGKLLQDNPIERAVELSPLFHDRSTLGLRMCAYLIRLCQ